jgi:ABC-type lipoprotein export system ATPase subunit
MIDEPSKIKNILIVGITGSGKSSLIKCLSNNENPLSAEKVQLKHNGMTYNFFKTLGIDSANKLKAIEHIVNTTTNINKVCFKKIKFFFSNLHRRAD